jgi:hypothetical protein
MMGKQTNIPGTEPKIHKDVSSAAEKYVEARDDRMAKTKKEVAARAVLIAAMKKHNLPVYDDPELELRVVYEVEDKVKVR